MNGTNESPIVTSQDQAPQEGAQAELILASGITTSGIAESAQVSVQAPPEREIAYTIKDAYFPDFHIRKSANAWWMDSGKVGNLIDAFKNGHTVKACLIYAGISQGQWEYFYETHPEFSEVKRGCEEAQMFRAMAAVNKDLDNPQTARWFLEKRNPKFKKNPEDDPDAPLQPKVEIGQVNLQVNAIEISTALRDIVGSLFGTSPDDAKAIVEEAMANPQPSQPGGVQQ